MRGGGVIACGLRPATYRAGVGRAWDRPQAGVGLDLLEHLAAVLAREIEVEQHQVGPRGVDMPVLPMQEVDRLDSVGRDVQFAPRGVDDRRDRARARGRRYVGGLTHSDLVAPPIAELHRQGWEHYLERLRIRAQGGDPGVDSVRADMA